MRSKKKNEKTNKKKEINEPKAKRNLKTKSTIHRISEHINTDIYLSIQQREPEARAPRREKGRGRAGFPNILQRPAGMRYTPSVRNL